MSFNQFWTLNIFFTLISWVGLVLTFLQVKEVKITEVTLLYWTTGNEDKVNIYTHIFGMTKGFMLDQDSFNPLPSKRIVIVRCLYYSFMGPSLWTIYQLTRDVHYVDSKTKDLTISRHLLFMLKVYWEFTKIRWFFISIDKIKSKKNEIRN